MAQAVLELGGLHILVNNAGKQQAQRSIADISSEQFDSTMKANLYALQQGREVLSSRLKTGTRCANRSRSTSPR